MLFDLPSLTKAYYSCRDGKRSCKYALDFEYDLEKNLYKLSQELMNRTYDIGVSSCFVITYPTIREIFAANFRDRIVHHLLVDNIEKEIDRKFIYDSLACRKQKGAIFGIKRLKSFLNKITQNRTKRAYYLKLDIQSFFYSINKDILASILNKEIYKLTFSEKEKEDLLWLSSKIIFHDPCNNYRRKGSLHLLKDLPEDKSLFRCPVRTGLPIGNLTSQFFANLYLNEVDQYIKRVLKVKYYLRYADDMLFLSNDRNNLRYIEEKVKYFLKERLLLTIKESKTKYGDVYQGIDFVGYIVRPNYILTRNRIVKNLKKKLYYFNNGYLINRKMCMEDIIEVTDEISDEEIKGMCSSINSVYGHLKWSNSYTIRKHIYEKHMGMLNIYLEPQEDLKFFRPYKPSC